LIRSAHSAGLPFSVETCPHYLVFASEEVPDGDARFKCAPPIRARENREELWKGLQEGLIDMIVSDHSPTLPEMKHLATGDLNRAWGGIASLQLTLPAVWMEMSRRGVPLGKLADWMCLGPAALVGLEGRKGAIAPGCDSDLVIFDPDAEYVVTRAQLHDRHRLTAYEGRKLRGRVVTTILRGRKVYDKGCFAAAPCGRLLMGKP
jgi:allantoinase